MKNDKTSGFCDYVHSIFNKQEFQISNIQELIELSVYSALAFFIPMFLKQPQFLVGSLVNMALVLAAFNLRGIKLLPVILFPSLGIIAGGYVFGGFTMYLVYALPFIWLGNALIVLAFKWLQLQHNLRFFPVLWIASAAKTAVILGAAFVLVSLAIIPKAFMNMGMLQLVTALVGGTMAFAVQKLKNRIPSISS
ncbi:MAG: hypothetical protein PHC66_01075 [Candidatus Nanoarchaeia archaeon]|nr:hypothetical protein [Candidatus Nanoarchaeia archaeon]MDD5239087.1 hypothetical protein [Candidatus Nanoarchaeia archaeon]